MKQLSTMSFAAKGLPPNWSIKSPTLAVDATILDAQEGARKDMDRQPGADRWGSASTVEGRYHHPII
jgi:hypothetical protein